MSRLCTSLFVASILSLSTAALAAHAAVVRTDHVEAELVAERTAVAPGEPLTLALRLHMMPGWHTYWRNPGDSGFPTRLAWQLPDGFSASALQWPLPQRLPAGPLTNFGYENEVFLLSNLTVPKHLSSQDVAIAARANWLVCSEDACIPESANLSLQLPVGVGAASEYAQAIARTRTRLPIPASKLSRWQFAARRLAHGAAIDVLPPTGAPLQSLTFFPYADSGIASAAPRLSSAAGVHRLTVESSPEQGSDFARLAGILVAPHGFGDADGPRAVTIDLPLDAAAPTVAAGASTHALTLSLALLFAFVGGLILNLMPCVLPVISIKVLSFVEHGADDPQGTRKHGLLFALGVVLSFWALAGLLLALRDAGAELGWGFQLQSPVVIALLALFFFALGLNLSGVFEVGMMLPGGISGWRARNPYVDSLASGALAVAVASPCTAPFMGAALGYAVSQSGVSAFLVFTALGIGMAAPYLLLAWFPRWLRYLPRPGQWMVRFKQFLAFPIYGTVVWLAWVFGLQAGVNALVMLLTATVMVGAAAWLLGMRPARPLIATAAAAVLALAAIVVAIPRGDAVSPVSAKSADAGWEAFSPKRVAAHTAAGQPVFVDFTAAWCVTCQVNKQLVLHSDEIKQAFESKGVIRVIADWTRQDESITRTLATFGRNGVPLYVLYRPHAKPLVLPAILTREAVLEALAKI